MANKKEGPVDRRMKLPWRRRRFLPSPVLRPPGACFQSCSTLALLLSPGLRAGSWPPQVLLPFPGDPPAPSEAREIREAPGVSQRPRGGDGAPRGHG